MSEKQTYTDKEIRDSAPLLFSMKKEAAEAPSGYFEEMQKEVMQKLHEESTPLVSISKPTSMRRWAVAASILVIIGMTFFFLNQESPTELRADSFNINLELDEEFLLDLDEDLIVEAYLDQMDEVDEDKEAYIDYLLDEDIELNDLFDDI